ncbi:penicillin-binding transpeptidase domain-containing protein [Kitasatospora sp. NPDC002040]|uniref:penicillin-binding transpeptidase domain-containing protein n=1 Tax=Kitasatospora sp. NPDC002040 TaxID=3154661 RepID=UPI00331E7B19
MHAGARIGVAAVTVAMFAGGGYAAYALVSDGGKEPARTASGGAAKPTGQSVVAEPPSAEAAAAGAKAFLAAWAKGDFEEAGRLTDRPDAAVAALTAFRTALTPTALTLTPTGAAPVVAPVGPSPSPSIAVAAPRGVPVAFLAEVGLPGAVRVWQYESAVAMVKTGDGGVVVHWDPTVVHPRLGPGMALAIRPVSSSAPSQVVDRKGRPVAEFPSVAAVLSQIEFADDGAQPTDGTGVVVTGASGGSGRPESLFTITASKDAAKKQLTLDADLQRVAEAVVKEQAGPASVVAVEPSTGHVLAFANNPTVGQNRAFGGATAPGSTMKVVTAAALLETGLTPDSPVPCPKNTNAGGRLVPNDFLDARPGYTFKDDFAQSCNTAFIEAAQARLKAGSLPAVAKDVFGLGLVWKTGLSAFDTDIPVETNAEQIALAYVGQGRIRTNALAMASVSATVQSGTFRQPVLVPGKAQPRAARTLSATVLNQLRSMMQRTAQSGTAAKALGSIPGAAAKTGTAEVGGQNPNSWITAYRGDLAVAVEVQAGGHGADAAAPAAAKLLQLGNNH